MGRPILPSALVLLLLLALAAIAFAEPSPTPTDDRYSLADLQQQMLERIRAANVSLPVGGSGAKSLQSYRIIDPYLIGDLITVISMLYSTVIYNYPDILVYDVMDLRLMLTQYAPQRIEFNYVNRV